MKNLLTAIKTQLQTKLTYVRNGDIFVTPAENYLPAHVKFPCVGIKDGAIEREIVEFSGVTEERLRVLLAAFVQIVKEEDSLIGVGATKGLLDMVDDIRTALDDNLLAQASMLSNFCIEERASEMFGDEKELIQQKVIVYEYVRHVA